jgi:GH43 family beta-xylosidase
MREAARRVMRLSSVVLAIGALAAAGFACSKSGTGSVDTGGNGPPACTFFNPVVEGADPWVWQQGANYFLVESRDNGIWVYRTTDLTKPKLNGVKVWSAPSSGWNRTHIWAPELHRIDGKWYIYYAGGSAGPPFIHQRSGVLESPGDDPQAQFVDKGMLYTGDDVTGGTNPIWAIDLTTDIINGQRYAVWSGWEADAITDRTPQHLYIATMANPWTISGNRVKISSPVESWEIGTELNLQEGPEFLVHGEHRFIIYSTRESWLPDYKLGQLKLASPTADPMLPESWTKSGPVFVRTPSVFGVGHNSFTKSPDGTEDWILYHSKVDASPGWNRVIRMQKFTWNADGSPNFGTPLAPGVSVPKPSGTC